MINRVVLVGRLTRDPELRVSQSNVAVANFNLAVNRPFTGKDGERGADFINIICFRKIAENVNQYVKKGSLVGIDGRIQTRNYENKEGQRVYVTEVIAESVQFLEPKGSGNNQQDKNAYGHSRMQQQPNQTTGQAKVYEENPFKDNSGPVNVNDDDLPF
ncbi:single-stranded DNA-binding protein [Jeotgalicoccus sp. FSL K6-3177]|uniref:single-stranded DNA-binding protein n=1 Tax=Jeotgalicoccus sp. FSL K6-3177 TaxID=2921494 RepID=UPI0030FDD34A